MPEVALTTTNATRFVAHNAVVKYECSSQYEAKGETVRSCESGKIIPSFKTNPLECGSKLLDL